MEETSTTNDASTENREKDAGKVESFTKIMGDMMNDMLNVFPELEETLDINLFVLWKQDSHKPSEVVNAATAVMEYCGKVYPARFFDILYENTDIFSGEEPCILLPGIDYRELWKENISDSTRATIWKYLQLILFSSVSNVSDGESFGETADLFKAINEDEFKKKLEETMAGMQDMFNGVEGEESTGNINLDDLPNAESVHAHVAGMMDGKLGALAKEIAEETAANLDMDFENATSVNDVFAKLMKDPNKIMGMVKDVGSKLDDKIKSGDIKESELLEEASELMKKMKEMPGMENIQTMLGKMGLGGKKLNTSAMQAHMERTMKLAQQKERLRARAQQKNVEKAENYTPEQLIEMEAKAEKARKELLEEWDNEPTHSVFRSGPRAERTSVKVKHTKGKKKGKKKK